MKKVPCPQCKNESEFSSENPFRPFCSERCQMIDLGKWANEEYAVPTEDTEVPDDVEREEKSSLANSAVLH